MEAAASPLGLFGVPVGFLLLRLLLTHRQWSLFLLLLVINLELEKCRT